MIRKTVTKTTTKVISSRTTATKTPSIVNHLFNELKKTQPKKKTNTSFTSSLDNLTKQSKVNLKGSKVNQMQQEEQEVVYQGVKGQPLNMSGMINPLQILQNTAMMQNQQMMMANNMFQGMNSMNSMPMSYASTNVPSGGTISIAQAESLITARTIGYNGSGAGYLTPELKREFATYLQRYVAEGAARGVDVVSMIKNKNGGSLKIGLANLTGKTIGVGGNPGTLFRASFWNSQDPGRRMGLFFQEISHQLGLMEDSQNPDYGWERGWMHGAVDATNTSVYNKNFDMLFEDMRKFNGRDGLRVVNMGATGSGMGAPSGGMPGATAAGDPYSDLYNGIMQGFQMGSQPGTPGAPAAGQAPIINIQPPQITPPAPIPTMQPSVNAMQPLQGVMPTQTNQPGGLSGPTVNMEGTSPYAGETFSNSSGGLDANIANSTQSFAAELDTIPIQSVPMLQGLAGALL